MTVTNIDMNRGSLKIILYILFATAVAIAFVIGWRRYQVYHLDRPRILVSHTQPDLPRISKVTGLNFPASARLEKRDFFLTLPGEYYLYAKIQMEPGEIEEFMAGMPQAGEREDYESKSIPEEIVEAYVKPEYEASDLYEWWNPAAAENYTLIVIHGATGSGTRLSVIVVKDDPLETKIYIRWHQWA